MAVVIPASGDHTFAIEAHNMTELKRLVTTKVEASTLGLRVGSSWVAFQWVRVLSLRPESSEPGNEIVAVRLSYKSCSVARSGPMVLASPRLNSATMRNVLAESAGATAQQCQTQAEMVHGGGGAESCALIQGVVLSRQRTKPEFPDRR